MRNIRLPGAMWTITWRSIRCFKHERAPFHRVIQPEAWSPRPRVGSTFNPHSLSGWRMILGDEIVISRSVQNKNVIVGALRK